METDTKSSVYLDTNVFIDALEGVEDLADPAIALLDFLRKRPGSGISSEITLLEIFCKAKIKGGPVLHRQYLSLLVLNDYFQLMPVTRDVIYVAADYRQRVQLAVGNDEKDRRAIDAIHVATALTQQCALFVTRDKPISLPMSFRRVSADEALAELRS